MKGIDGGYKLSELLFWRPLFRRKIGKFVVTIEVKFVDIVATFFVEKNLKMRTGPLGESI